MTTETPIKILKYYWNDKLVSEAEYQQLDEEWKQKCINEESSEDRSEKKSRKTKK
jgi:hypothetical protein